MKNKGASNSPDRVEVLGSPGPPPALHEQPVEVAEVVDTQEAVTAQPRAERFKETILPSLRGSSDKGKVWDVTIIEVGESLNGPIYTEEALKGAVSIFEGVPVYTYKWGEDLGHLSDEARAQDSRGLAGNLVGSLEDVHFNEGDNSLDGCLKVYCEDTRSKLMEAWDMGDIGKSSKRDILGLSIDAQGVRGDDGRTVVQFTEASSVDIVTAPAAGGRIRRLVAALRLNEPNQESPMPSSEIGLQEDFATKLRQYADALTESPEGPEAQEILKTLMTELSSMLGEEEPDEEKEMEEAKPAEAVPVANGQYDQLYQEHCAMKEAISDLLSSKLVKGDPRLVEAFSKIVPEEATLTEDQQTIQTLQERLCEQAIASELAKHAVELRLHNPDLALRLIDRDSIQVGKDYQEVTGLREALVALIKAEPYLAQEAVDEKEEKDSEAVTVDTETVNVQHVAEAKKAPIGQGAEAVALRESVQQGRVQMSADQITRRMAHLRNKALQGDCRAAVEHKRLRQALNQ